MEKKPKDIRPKLNKIEIDLIVKAMEIAGYHEASYFSPEEQIHTRFKGLQGGYHYRTKRITRKPEGGK